MPVTDMELLGNAKIDSQEYKLLHPYDLGMTTASACQYDQRFSYNLYVPKRYRDENRGQFRLLVAVHGTDRPNQRLLDRFQSFADEHDFIVLAPLFPARVTEPDDMDNYKYLLYKDIRFDLVLLSMIGEVRSRYGLDQPKFSLFGFSGGAHFAHRFLLLYPELLSSVSIAAPGCVTQIDYESDWWVGIADTESLFGRRVDLAALREVPIHLVVGAEDTNTNGIVRSADNKHWMAGADQSGENRIDRLRTLSQNLQSHRVATDFEVLPNIGHEEGPLTAAAIEYFRRTLCDQVQD